MERLNDKRRADLGFSGVFCSFTWDKGNGMGIITAQSMHGALRALLTLKFLAFLHQLKFIWHNQLHLFKSVRTGTMEHPSLNSFS